MRKVLAAAACLLALSACVSPAGGSGGSPPAQNSDAYTPAATLRVKLDLLFVEHTTTLAKLTLAASAGRRDEFFAYAKVLALNSADVTVLFRMAIGETSSAQLNDAWTNGNNYAVDYIVAASTHDDAASQVAIQHLSNDYVTQLAAALGPAVAGPPDVIPKLVAAGVMALKTLVDDAVAGSYQTSFADIAEAITSSAGFADVLAGKIAQQYPDRFPGDPGARASATRAGLAVDLSVQAAYYSMLTQAIVAGATGERAGANAALAANTPHLSAVFTTWAKALDPLSAYAQNGDATSRQDFLSVAPAAVAPAFNAVLQVVDDQRAKAYAQLGPDDRSATAAFATIADAQNAGG